MSNSFSNIPMEVLIGGPLEEMTSANVASHAPENMRKVVTLFPQEGKADKSNPIYKKIEKDLDTIVENLE